MELGQDLTEELDPVLASELDRDRGRVSQEPEVEVDLVRGLVWDLGRVPDSDLARELGNLLQCRGRSGPQPLQRSEMPLELH